ncbi:OsmC family protein [Bradyrhizobium cenepequi]|uniref:OsmC family protein n=1 Tax=Bradyrhizobium cenepequi TaxID=2821403 RepID=UPI001CE254A2|nr:OsmC family protein [Bradyrhizobium cenepequi]MCA6108341.1 OsmC family protein [Bradyrhizobium cenepequi]
MMNSNHDGAPRPQADVAGDLDGAGTLNGRAGESVFSIGGPDGRGGTAAGANPYELLSASLAACTAMTIRLQARRQKIPLSHVEVAVSYHHGEDGGRDSFKRSITLEGNLGDDGCGGSPLCCGQPLSLCSKGKNESVSANNESVSRELERPVWPKSSRRAHVAFLTRCASGRL